jgi:hypothetical protein
MVTPGIGLLFSSTTSPVTDDVYRCRYGGIVGIWNERLIRCSLLAGV